VPLIRYGNQRFPRDTPLAKGASSTRDAENF